MSRIGKRPIKLTLGVEVNFKERLLSVKGPKGELELIAHPAIELLIEARSVDTPVVLARQLGRDEEEIDFYTLNSFPINKVDMLSIILVGNSHTLLKEGWAFTPRGY